MWWYYNHNYSHDIINGINNFNSYANFLDDVKSAFEKIKAENTAMKEKIELLEDKVEMQQQIIDFQADYIENGYGIDWREEA